MGDSPNLVQGQEPTAEQWNGYFIEKADDVVFTGDNGTGGVEGLVPPPPPGTGPAGWVLCANGRWVPGTSGGTPGVLIQTITYVTTSGGTVTISAPETSVDVIQLIPSAELASLTVTLPAGPLVEGQIVELATTQTIDALTVNSSDSSTVFGGTMTLMANGGASWRYRLSNTTWYRRY